MVRFLRQGPRQRRAFIAATAVGALALTLSACSTDNAPSKEEWLQTTAGLFQSPVELGEDDYYLQVFLDPPGGEFDAYRVASTISALGSEPVSEGATNQIEQALETLISNEEPASAPPLYVLEMITRANQVSPFLAPDDLDESASVFTSILEASPPADAVDAMTAARIASRLDAVEKDPAWAACPAPESEAFMLLASRATASLVGVSPELCDPDDAGWHAALEALETKLSQSSELIDVLDCETLSTLSMSTPSTSLDRLRHVYDLAADKLRDEMTRGEPTSCLASLHEISTRMSFVPPRNTTSQLALLDWQMSGGGPPDALSVTPRLVSTARTLAEITNTERLPSDAELEWMGTVDGSLFNLSPEAISEHQAEIRTMLDSGDARDRQAVLQSIMTLGEASCTALGVSGLFPSITGVGTDSASDVLLQTLALSTLRMCDVGASESQLKAEAAIAENTLAHVADQSVDDVYRAQAALCIVDPERMLPSESIWSTFAPTSSEFGGILNGGRVSVDDTMNLASMLAISKQECKEGELLW